MCGRTPFGSASYTFRLNATAWIEESGYTMAGAVRGLGIKSYANCDNENDFLTELQIPVEKA